MGVGQIDQLNLANHHGSIHLSYKPTTPASQPGGEGCARDDRGFLDHHWHQHVAAVHDEVRGNTQGQCIAAHGVLDHGVRPVEAQPHSFAEEVGFLVRQDNLLPHQGDTFLNRECIESAQSRRRFRWHKGCCVDS